MSEGGSITVQPNGDFVWSFPQQPTYTGAPRIYYVTGSPPRFTLDNYIAVLNSTGVAQSFINSLTVAIPVDRHPDHDRGLCRLCAGLDAVPVPRRSSSRWWSACWSCRCRCR